MGHVAQQRSTAHYSGVHPTAEGNGINLQRGTWNARGHHSAQHRQSSLCSETIDVLNQHQPSPALSSPEEGSCDGLRSAPEMQEQVGGELLFQAGQWYSQDMGSEC